MESFGYSEVACRKIDDDTVELHAMGKLVDPSIREHLNGCTFCRGRVAEHRSWIEDLKQGLREYRQENQLGAKAERKGEASNEDDRD